jgi:hypothetical protein
MERKSKYLVDELETASFVVPLAMLFPMVIAFRLTGLLLTVAVWGGLRAASLLIATGPTSQYNPLVAEERVLERLAAMQADEHDGSPEAAPATEQTEVPVARPVALPRARAALAATAASEEPATVPVAN